MSNINLSIINDLYKPIKYTRKKSAIILDCTDRKIVLKKKSENVKKIHDYLTSRGFDNYIKIVDDNRDEFYVYEYKDEYLLPPEQKAVDLSRTVALLHAKTSYMKNVDSKLYLEIYEKIKENIEYLLELYSTMYDDIFYKENYTIFDKLFMDYYSKLSNTLYFCENELDLWYEENKDKTEQRVSLVHNNLSMDNYIKSDDDYLISFDNAKIDTPVLDLVNFFKKEYLNINFSDFYEKYLYTSQLNNDEQKLFFILISIPNDSFTKNDELENFINLCSQIKYLEYCEKLIGPYYPEYNEVKNT